MCHDWLFEFIKVHVLLSYDTCRHVFEHTKLSALYIYSFQCIVQLPTKEFLGSWLKHKMAKR